MNKKRMLSLLTVIMVVISLATVAFATEGSAAPEAAATESAAAAETTTEAAATPWYSGIISFAPMIIIILVFYFVLIRPENKRKKETAKMRDSIEKGDEITTIGGIMGTVTKVKDDEIVIETGSGADKCKMRFTKWAISSVNTKAGEAKKSKNEPKEDIEEDTEE